MTVPFGKNKLSAAKTGSSPGLTNIKLVGLISSPSYVLNPKLPINALPSISTTMSLQ